MVGDRKKYCKYCSRVFDIADCVKSCDEMVYALTRKGVPTHQK